VDHPVKPFNSIGEEEARAVAGALIEGPLSGYTADRSLGGRLVTRLEHDWAETFKVTYAVAVNSGTSGLLAACMAIQIKPGDEVIVSPYTMSATAAAPKLLGAKLVWCDINPWTYTMDAGLVEKLITKRTKAVIVTNLFGQAAHLRRLRNICDGKGLYLIEDNAQAIFASEYEALCGTVGHIGVFSLNVHKHLQVGEGGVVITSDPELDGKLRGAINHGECRNTILGLNLRMTEVTAAMARVQLNRAKDIMRERLEFAMELENQAHRQQLPLTTPFVRPECGHSFYCWAAQLKYSPSESLPHPWRLGYMNPLYTLPALEENRNIHLPVVERIESKMVLMEICSIDPTNQEIATMVSQLKEVL
jgi:dTDP-4-amino-4,6-dideoxygalactose transaminase